jgi:RNA polymerase sigma-70 factor (sigma-E family)
MALIWQSKLPPEATTWAEQASPRLMGTAMALTMNRADAEDLVQETVIQALTKWSKVARSDHPDAYVRKMLVNHFISGRRRRSSTEVISHEVATGHGRPTPTAESALVDRAALNQLMSTLPPKQRAVLVLRYYHDLPDRAVADILECSEGNVRVMAKRALDSIRPRATATIV